MTTYQCKPYKRHLCSNPPFECLCGKIIKTDARHFCRNLKSIYELLELEQFNASPKTDRTDEDNQRKFNLGQVFQYAEELMVHPNGFIKKVGAALLLAYKFGLRTSKGSWKTNERQSLWTLRREHFQLNRNLLTISYLYEAEPLCRTFELSNIQMKAFQHILQTRDTYMLASTRTTVKAYLDQKYGINLIAARRGAINAYFWKILANYNRGGGINEVHQKLRQ